MVAPLQSPFGAPDPRPTFELLLRDVIAALTTADQGALPVEQLRALVDALAAQPASEFTRVRERLSSEPVSRSVLELLSLVLARVQAAPSHDSPREVARRAVALEVDHEVAQMQGPEARGLAQAAFEANAEQLGSTAVAAATRRD
jgi:hypothetical protein